VLGHAHLEARLSTSARTADAVSDRVMRMSVPHEAATPHTPPAETPWANTLRRACDACEDDDEPLRASPQPASAAVSLAHEVAVDTGDDLLAKSKSIQVAVDSIRRGLQRVLVDLVMPNEEGISGLDDYDLPNDCATVRYRKVTRPRSSRAAQVVSVQRTAS